MRKNFYMEFEPNTIEHLGQKLYSTLPPVMGELVSNSWDADSKKVEITLPIGEITSQSEIVIKDWGHGMNDGDLQDKYLIIGLNRREVEGTDKSPGGRYLMGRKGLGKLSAFGIATLLEIRTIKDKEAICIRLDYEEMKKWPRKKPYEPKIVTERCGKTTEKKGTEIRIKRLTRKTPITEEYLDSFRKNLARRFSVIGKDFAVVVNGYELTAKDRRLKEECRKAWDVSELPNGGIVDETNNLHVTGWIGLVSRSSRKDTGVDIFAKGKAAELGTFFEKTTDIQFSQAYILGEVHADFLDVVDSIATARNSVHWETDSGQKLKEWGTKALRFVSQQWLELQRQEKEEKVIKISGFDAWLETRNKREQKIAKKLLKAIVEDEKVDPESSGPLIDIIKTNIEQQAFLELVDEIEESGISIETLLKLFEEWRVVQARDLLKLFDGRHEVMKKLYTYIHEGALEVQKIQPLFEREGWLIDSTWIDVTGQTRYSDLLRVNFPESPKLEEKDRRIDILGYHAGGEVRIVELKRPEKILQYKDLNQIEEYVRWAKTEWLGTGRDSPKFISGLLVVGDLSHDGKVSDKMISLAGENIRVETFLDIYNRAKNVYGDHQKRLKSLAPEYSREARRKAKEKTSVK